VKPFLTAHLAPKNWADVLLTTMNVRHDSPPTIGYVLFYGGIGVALMGLLGLLPQRQTLLLRVVKLAAVIGRASFVCYVLQQWIIDFMPLWVGFDSWLTPLTTPVYLALNTVLMYWLALIWGRHKANRFMTFGLQPGSPSPAVRPVFACSVLLVVVINLLALENATRLTPGKLALFPINPYPWAPAKVAGHQ
jgi:hypothetical protein